MDPPARPTTPSPRPSETVRQTPPDDSGVVAMASHVYPGIQVYYLDQSTNTATPLFKVVRLLSGRRLLVQTNSGAVEEIERNDYLTDEFIVKKADVVALGGNRTW
jgi:hypothetical protein